MKIGWSNLGYPVTRTILDKVNGVEYVRSRSFAAMISRLCSIAHVPSKGILNFGFTYIGGSADCRVDLFHFFNHLGVGLCRRPYVTTFETSVPRGLKYGDYWFQRGLESLMSNRCRKLLALSDCTKIIQLTTLRYLLSKSDLEVVAKKIEVIHPPQKIVSVHEKHKSSSGLKAVFVGRDFFRKGGGETLRAFSRLRKHYPVELWLVGDLTRFGYACDPSVDDTVAHMKLIEANQDWIHWFPSLPNDKVLELMQTCDIGLLPTRADTYGYSVLEMQACGLPVITTDVRALPEINNESCGWVIQGCGKRDGRGTWGEADYTTTEKISELSQMIERGIYDQCVEILSRPECVVEKGSSALLRVRKFHDPIKYGENIFSIYQDAISR